MVLHGKLTYNNGIKNALNILCSIFFTGSFIALLVRGVKLDLIDVTLVLLFLRCKKLDVVLVKLLLGKLFNADKFNVLLAILSFACCEL